MDVLYERCCGIDVHKKTVVACLITPGAGGAPTKETRTYGTMTGDLLELLDWLLAAGCTQWRWSRRACSGRRRTT